MHPVNATAKAVQLKVWGNTIIQVISSPVHALKEDTSFIIADKNIPVFVKEGSMIVTGPVMQYSTEKPADSLIITIYGKKDASFVLYEDENENYNYENGKYATIKFEYNVSKNSFSISNRKGSFDGMLSGRVFKIILVDKNNKAKSVEKYVQCTGSEMAIPL